MYSVRYISILDYRFFDFWSVDFSLQCVNLPYGHFSDYSWPDTVEKCYFQAFLLFPVISMTGARIWMKKVEMEENGI